MRIPSGVTTAVFSVPGFALQIYGIANGHSLWALAGSLLLSIGLSQYIAHKGYHPVWGLWGFVPIMGVLLLAIQWPREELEKFASTSSQRESTTILGGRPLLAVMAPAGIAVMLLSGYFIGDDFGPSQGPAPTALDELEAPAPDPKPADSKDEPPQDQPQASTAGDTPEGQPDQQQPDQQDQSSQPVPWPARVQRGMTSEEVTKMAGQPGETIVGGPQGNRITRWKTEDGRYVFVRFRNNLVQRANASSSPDETEGPEEADEAKPSQEGIDEAVAKVLESAQPPAAPETKPVPEQPLPPEESDKAKKSEKPDLPKKVTRIDNPSAPAARTTYKKAALPTFTDTIPAGPHQVVLHNPNAFPVQAGIRSGRKGKDINIPARGTAALQVYNGRYNIYFLKPDAPDRLCEAPTIDVQSPPDTLHIQLQAPPTQK